MFSALILVCAVYSGQVSDNCVGFEDTWGPYKTVEKCSIRTNQMVSFLSGRKQFVFETLGNPEGLKVMQKCTPEGELL